MTDATRKKLKDALHKIGQSSAAVDSKNGHIYHYDYDMGESVFKDYETVKDEIKTNISSKNFPADRHKIATFFLSAILKNRPVKLKENSNDTNNDDMEFFANVNLGVVFAAYCIKEMAGLNIKILSPNGNVKSYTDQFFTLIKEIKEHIDQNGSQKILWMAISHIFFLLEEYAKSAQEKNLK